MSSNTKTNKVKTKTAYMWIEDGIAFIQGTGICPTVEDVKNDLEEIKKQLTTSKTPLFIDTTLATNIPKEVRDMWSNPQITQPFSAIAFLADSYFTEWLVNLTLTFSKPIVPSKMFLDKYAAIAWLKNIHKIQTRNGLQYIPGIEAQAIHTKTSFGKLISSILNAFKSSHKLIKQFSSREKAIEWLNKNINKPASIIGNAKDINQYKEILEVITAYTKKDFTKKIQLDSSKEPLEIIAKSINILGEELFHAIKEQELINLHLEEIVNDRTMQLKRQQEKIQHSAKLAALGEMAGGIAHEINNPVTIIYGMCKRMNKLLEQEPISKEKLLETSNHICTATTRIADIVKSMRIIARDCENDPFLPTKVKTIIEDSLGLCRERFRGHGIELIVKEIPNLEIECQSIQIAQIIINLLNNAHDAVENVSPKTICLSVEEKGEYVEISITDNGKGVSKEAHEKIFQPFFTTKEVGKGTGLGLSISKSLAKNHGGELFLDNSSESTKFVLKLPIKRIKTVDMEDSL